MIERQQNTYNWHFTFLGANQDAMLEGGKIAATHSMNFAATGQGISESYRNSREIAKSYRARKKD